MSKTDKIVAMLLFGLAAVGYLYFFVYVPKQEEDAKAQERLNEVGGVDLQPTNQRKEDPLGKTLGVSDGG